MRQRRERRPAPSSSSLRRNQRRYGGYVVHLGVDPHVRRLRGSHLQPRRDQACCKPGERWQLNALHAWSIARRDPPGHDTPHYAGAIARVALYHHGEPKGDADCPRSACTSSRNSPPRFPRSYEHAAIEDFYMILVPASSRISLGSPQGLHQSAGELDLDRGLRLRLRQRAAAVADSGIEPARGLVNPVRAVLWALAALLVWSSSTEAATVRGVLANPERPESVAGRSVELLGLDPDGRPIEQRATSDARGEFVFSDLRAPAVYLPLRPTARLAPERAAPTERPQAWQIHAPCRPERARRRPSPGAG